MNKQQQPNTGIQTMIDWNNKMIELKQNQINLLSTVLVAIEKGEITEIKKVEKLLKMNGIQQQIMNVHADILSKQNYNSKFVGHIADVEK